MTPQERYLFDLQGYLVVPDALSAEQVTQLNRIMDGRVAEAVDPNATRHRWMSMLNWGDAYRDLIDNPRILPYLEEIIGQQIRLDHDYSDLIRNGHGPIGCTLHGGGAPFDPCMFSTQRDNRMFNGLTVVAYNLKDVNPGDGGFGCVPGSHKSNYPIPQEWLELSNPHNVVKRVTAPAGSAVIFTEALTHGTLPWMGKNERRTLFYKYSPACISWSANYYEEKNYPGLTDRQKALLEAPNARYGHRKNVKLT